MEGSTITYRQQKSFCSKPGCRKCREGTGHGPYWYAYQAVNGRNVRTYIGKTLPASALPEQIMGAAAPSSQTARANPSFRLITFGQLRLESLDKHGTWHVVTEASWRQPPARALLACLVCVPQRQLTRQQICAQLWPSMDEKSATHNLRRASAALTQALGSNYSKQDNNVLALAGQTQLWIDCTAFEDGLSQVSALPAQQKEARVALLEEAVKLYSGDFLPEERVVGRVQEKRTSLRRQWLKAMLDLVDFYLDEQRPVTAIDLLEQILAAEPANEAAVQRLMLALARQQRRIEAVQAYQRLVTIFNTTSQATPTPETQSLFRAIQQGQELRFKPLSVLAGTEGGESTRTHHTDVDMDGTLESEQLPNKAEEAEHMVGEVSIGRINQSPLVGRNLELVELHQLLAQVEAVRGWTALENNGAPAHWQNPDTRPRARCRVLMGEAGIGKTRLAEESAREAQRRGWTVIWSRAYPQEQGIPYRLWTATLRSVLSNTPNLVQRAAEFASLTTYQPLRALVPDLQEKLVGAGIRSAQESATYEMLLPEQEELRLRDAVYTFLITLSFASPLLIILDDIQWTDESSVQMLGYLTRRMNEHPIVLLATCRETELAANRVLNNLIAHMQREQVVEILHVQPLSDEQIGALVSYLPAPSISQVQSQAAGNPFFAEELGYSLRTNATPLMLLQPDTPEETQTLPGTIAAALNQRLNRLSQHCLDLLGKAAVLGGSFDFTLISALEVGSTADDNEIVLDLLDEALHAGVLTEEGSTAHATYHFWHPLLASHLYNGLTATRRARLHRRIADELPRIYASHESEEAATITRHLIRGGAEPAHIARYAEMAAHHAYGLFAYPEAEYYYRLALTHLAPVLLDPCSTTRSEEPLLPGITLEHRLRLALMVERMAECARILGHFQDAPNLFMRVLQLRTTPPRAFATPAEERQEAQIQAMLWSEIAWIRRYTGDTAAARSCNKRGEEVLRAAQIPDGPAWGSLRHQRASLFWQEGYHQEALQAAQEALALFTASLATSATELPAIPAGEQTRIRRTLQGDPINPGRVHNLLGIIYTAMGQLSKALAHLQQALAINDQYERRRESANVYCNTGHVHLMRAEFEQARPFFQRALNYAEQSGDIPVKSVALYNMGELATADHRFDEAEKLYREGLALVAQMNDREYLSQWHTFLGNTYQEQGKFREAAAVILRSLAIGRAISNQPCIGIALIALANLRIALVEHEHPSTDAKRQRVLRHAETDLRRALSLHGLDAETRTRAQLAQVHVLRLRGDLVLARQQAQTTCLAAQQYELKALQARCEQVLASLPEI